MVGLVGDEIAEESENAALETLNLAAIVPACCQYFKNSV